MQTASRLMTSLGVVGVIAAAGAFAAGARSTSDPALSQAYFVSQCGFSHFANDDPIRFPRQPGRSHNHTFFGNQSTSANSTLRSLLDATSNCDRDGDKAAYWAPTLFAHGRPVKPTGAQVYYKRVTHGSVRPFPQGFRLIAGNMDARTPQNRRTVAWVCSSAPDVTAPAPLACPAGATLLLRVRFPNCWDGSASVHGRAARTVYAKRGACPFRFPIRFPSLELVISYPQHSTNGLSLASGGVYSAHADFINAWQRDKLAQLVDLCLNDPRGCGRLPPSEGPPGG